MFNVTLNVRQNASFTKNFVWKTGDTLTPVDLTGCTAIAQVRSSIESPDVVFTFNTTDGTILLGGVAGSIVMKMSPSQSLTISEGTYYYDLMITFPDTTKVALIEGLILVKPSVTRI